MKKAISLILVVVLVMAMAIPAFAAMPETIEPQACIHSDTLTPVGNPQQYKSRYRDATYCQDCYVIQYNCSACGATVTHTEWIDGTEKTHKYVVYNATCDGTTQTWYYHCDYCSHAKPGSPTTVTCKRAHINGVCTTLPV